MIYLARKGKGKSHNLLSVFNKSMMFHERPNKRKPLTLITGSRDSIIRKEVEGDKLNIESLFLPSRFFFTPLLDRTVAKRRYITPKLFIVISFFFFPLIDNLIKFCYKQRMSHQLKNLSLLLTINEYCMFHIEAFFSPTTFSLL